MRCLVQRVSHASVSINQVVHGAIEQGLLIFVGFTAGDTLADVEKMVHKLSGLRIFSDEEGKMNRSLSDINGSVLIISQFTLYGSAKKGFRPSFTKSLGPDDALPLYHQFLDLFKRVGLDVAEGIFGADMSVSLTNDGPVTLIIESKDGVIIDR